MKKNKALSRVYLGSYILWIFGGLLCPLLLIYVSKPFAYVILSFVILDLACIIVSHVFYNKKRELFPLFSTIGIGCLNFFILFAFILECVITGLNTNKSFYTSPYAWIILVISILALAPIDIFLVKNNTAIKKELNTASK